MKHTLILLSYACCLFWLFAFAGAAIPEHWDVDLAAQPPQVFTLQRPRGETYELNAVLNVRGKPFAPAITNACIYWQTNGMANLYWSAPASVSNNVLRAFWLPEMDPGATTVRGYIGDPGHIYAAAFQFRFIASPGPTPNVLPLPTPVIDFAKVRVLNPPWPTSAGTDTNAVTYIANATIETNTLVVATANRVNALVTATNDLASSVSRLESATNDLASSVSRLESSKADKSEYGYVEYDGSHNLTLDESTGFNLYGWSNIYGSMYFHGGFYIDGWRATAYFTDESVIANDDSYRPGTYYFPWSWTYDHESTPSSKKLALVSQIEAAGELEDTVSNVVWKLEAEGGRFFFKPVRPINMED